MERAERAKAMRRPWKTTAGGWHTEIHDPHAHHHHESSHRLFFRIFLRGSSTTCYLRTSLIFVELARVVYPSWGTNPRNFQLSGTGIVAALQPSCQITREEGAIIGLCIIMVVFGSIGLLSLHAPTDHHSDSTPDSKRVRLCSQLRCGSYGTGSPTAVVCSRGLVCCCGNGGTLCCS